MRNRERASMKGVESGQRVTGYCVLWRWKSVLLAGVSVAIGPGVTIHSFSCLDRRLRGSDGAMQAIWRGSHALFRANRDRPCTIEPIAQ